MKKVAWVISWIFEPIAVMLLVISLETIRSGLTGLALWRFLTIVVVAMVAPPVLLLVWAVRTRRISDHDVSKRTERVGVFGIFALFLVVDLFLVHAFGNGQLFMLFCFFALWFAGLFAITLFWKISGHTAVVTFIPYFFVRWYGMFWYPLVFLIPLVLWARVITKRHTIAQAIAGVVYSGLVILLLDNWIIG